MALYKDRFSGTFIFDCLSKYNLYNILYFIMRFFLRIFYLRLCIYINCLNAALFVTWYNGGITSLSEGMLELLNLCTLGFNNFLPLYIHIYIKLNWNFLFQKFNDLVHFQSLNFQLFFSPSCIIESHLSGSSIRPIKTRCISNVWTRYRLKLSRKLKTFRHGIAAFSFLDYF